MLQLISDNPWLVPVALGLLVPISAIVCGTWTGYRVRVRKAELEAGLIQEMLQRGMSAEDIRTVLDASPKKAAKRLQADSARFKD